MLIDILALIVFSAFFIAVLLGLRKDYQKSKTKSGVSYSFGFWKEGSSSWGPRYDCWSFTYEGKGFFIKFLGGRNRWDSLTHNLIENEIVEIRERLLEDIADLKAKKEEKIKLYADGSVQKRRLHKQIDVLSEGLPQEIVKLQTRQEKISNPYP